MSDTGFEEVKLRGSIVYVNNVDKICKVPLKKPIPWGKKVSFSISDKVWAKRSKGFRIIVDLNGIGEVDVTDIKPSRIESIATKFEGCPPWNLYWFNLDKAWKQAVLFPTGVHI